MKKLPIGIQTFEKLINSDCLYADKTVYIHKLITEGGFYLLSRPRRFGKSLLVSTLKAVFQGKRNLFQGFDIEKLAYDWTPHPVVHLDLSGTKYQSTDDLGQHLVNELDRNASENGVSLEQEKLEHRFRELIEKLVPPAPPGVTREKAVILIDEYDKPILDTITNQELVEDNRNALKGFYSVMKAADQHIRFVLLTGVSKFARVSVFSDLNNLNDISMDYRYACLLGYTQAELESLFNDRLPILAGRLCQPIEAVLREIKKWYNGYRFFDNAELVYNPFSTLLLFDHLKFDNFWFETGTTFFLLKVLKESGFDLSKLENLCLKASGFSNFEIEKLRPEPLLYQTGYLTIKEYNAEKRLYTLGYPNYEVESAFVECLMDIPGTLPSEEAPAVLEQLAGHVKAGRVDDFMQQLRIFFAGIQYDIQIKSEKYYQSIFYLVFKLLSFNIRAECRSNMGRTDATLETGRAIYLFEFKLHDTAESALSQIKERKYYEKYLGTKKRIVMVGVEFDKKERNLGKWLVEELISVKPE